MENTKFKDAMEAWFKQTAKDYAVDVYIIKNIYKQYPNSFYVELEKHIKETNL